MHFVFLKKKTIIYFFKTSIVKQREYKKCILPRQIRKILNQQTCTVTKLTDKNFSASIDREYIKKTFVLLTYKL